MSITLSQQIEEVNRELALRTRVYPGWVAKNKMRQGEADMHMARMEAVKRTLEWLATNEATIKETIRVVYVEKERRSDEQATYCPATDAGVP